MASRQFQNRSEWSHFAQGFQDLALALAQPNPLLVSEDISGEGNLRRWVIAPAFVVSARFKELAQQAGKALGSPKRSEPEDFWFECLSTYLWKQTRSGYLDIIETSSGGVHHQLRLIKDAIRASVECCDWLSSSGHNEVVMLVTASSSRSLPWKASSGRHRDRTFPNHGGEVWAARMNRKREARARIVEALGRLAQRHENWPTFVRDWQASAGTDPIYSYRQIPHSFQPPDYDRLGTQTLGEWKAAADKAWAKHRDECISEWRHWEDAGLDEKVLPPSKSRGAGSAGKVRINADLSKRYTWAALRLMGNPWKQIDTGTSTVKKAASRVLHFADWPTDMRKIRQALNKRTLHSKALAEAGLQNQSVAARRKKRHKE